MESLTVISGSLLGMFLVIAAPILTIAAITTGIRGVIKNDFSLFWKVLIALIIVLLLIFGAFFGSFFSHGRTPIIVSTY